MSSPRRRRRPRWVGVRLVAAPLLLVLALVSGCNSLQGTNDKQFAFGDGNITEVALDNRTDPVSVSGTSLQGDQVDVADYRGQPVVINVWSSSCNPCIKEMPLLVEAEKSLPDVQFVGIDIREPSQQNGIAFEKARGADYPSIYDPGSTTLLGFGRDYIPQSMPSTVVLDATGRVAAIVSGAVPSALTLTELVKQVAAEHG